MAIQPKMTTAWEISSFPVVYIFVSNCGLLWSMTRQLISTKGNSRFLTKDSLVLTTGAHLETTHVYYHWLSCKVDQSSLLTSKGPFVKVQPSLFPFYSKYTNHRSDLNENKYYQWSCWEIIYKYGGIVVQMRIRVVDIVVASNNLLLSKNMSEIVHAALFFGG